MFDNKDAEAPEAPAVAVQSGGVSDPSDINWICNDWIECEKCALNYPPFTQQQLEAIRLQAILRNSKACLGTYDSAMNWHFRANGDVHMHEMASSRHFLSHHDLCRFLKKGTTGTLVTALSTNLCYQARKVAFEWSPMTRPKFLETRPKWRETGIIKDWILLLEKWCLWTQQHVQKFNSSPQSPMQQNRENVHKKHTTKVQKQNATTLQLSPKASQTWREIGLLRKTFCNSVP